MHLLLNEIKGNINVPVILEIKLENTSPKSNLCFSFLKRSTSTCWRHYGIHSERYYVKILVCQERFAYNRKTNKIFNGLDILKKA